MFTYSDTYGYNDSFLTVALMDLFRTAFPTRPNFDNREFVRFLKNEENEDTSFEDAMAAYWENMGCTPTTARTMVDKTKAAYKEITQEVAKESRSEAAWEAMVS